MGQVNENDNNRNRKYPTVDARIRDTYARASSGSLGRALYDPYVRFFRFAADRLKGRNGIVCLVTNNSFSDRVSFDGMRKHLAKDFNRIYHLDLGGDIKSNPHLSGTKHNVFGVQVGIGITLAIRSDSYTDFKLFHTETPTDWTRFEKLDWLKQAADYSSVEWRVSEPTDGSSWRDSSLTPEWTTNFLPLGTKETKSSGPTGYENSIFKQYALGTSTNRDRTAYASSVVLAAEKAKSFLQLYGMALDRWKREKPTTEAELLAFYSSVPLEWSETLKRRLRSHQEAVFDPNSIVRALYRPYVRQHLYLGPPMVDRPGIGIIFKSTVRKNRAICLSAPGTRSPFSCLMAADLPDLHVPSTDGSQVFPLYVGAAEEIRPNVTSWAIERFRQNYQRADIDHEAIFDYVYALLHHPSYRATYASKLKSELPRIPLAPDFDAFRVAGSRLSNLHLNFESEPQYKLDAVVDSDVPFSWRVSDKLRISGDRKNLRVNGSLVLDGIPERAFEYRLGNRSALEWIVDQFQERSDRFGNIAFEPNPPGDDGFVARLVGSVISVSLETLDIVESLPSQIEPAYCEDYSSS